MREERNCSLVDPKVCRRTQEERIEGGFAVSKDEKKDRENVGVTGKFGRHRLLYATSSQRRN